MVVVPTLLDERRDGLRAARAPRGAGPRQPRSAHPLRDPERLHGRPRARACRRTRRSWPPPGRESTALNARHGEGRADRFYLFHRVRQWNPGEGVLMGWERKRGKIEEWNRLLRGAADTSFSVASRRRLGLPRRPLLHHPRLRHAPAAGRREEADRHHRPPPEPAPLRPARRPRHRGLRDPPAPGQRHHGQRRRLALRAPVRRPHRRRPLHDRGVGHVPGPLRRGHLHRQGALRRGRVRGRPRGARARERPALARPLRGALRPHGARHRRRGRGRLSRERPRPRAAPAPLGARRLADPLVAVPGRPHAAPACAATACPSSRAGRSSTTCGAA